MKNRQIIVAFDTSNYTTSAAVIDTDGTLIANLKRPLKVAEGERGLRQSDALFAHTVNLPSLVDELKSYVSGCEIAAVGVSEKPRNVHGSYMPCFLAGVCAAESFALGANAPLYKFSHQCGHVMAAIYSSGAYSLISDEFAAFHISGGTTELLRVRAGERGFDTELVGGTLDLNAGQIIDRVGVYMGLGFPAGPELERLALTNNKNIPKKKISINKMSVNLSGLENMAVKLYDETGDKAFVAAFVLDYIKRSIIAMSEAYEAEYGKSSFVYAGGVMSNSIIKKSLSERFEAYFAEPQLSADNAVGIAALTLGVYKSE